METFDVANVKYPKTKILLVDVDESAQKKLVYDGFNIELGTFGYAYPSYNGEECYLNGDIGTLDGVDIVVVSLYNLHEASEFPYTKHQQEFGVVDRTYMASNKKNYFDGRLAYAHSLKGSFEKFVSNGGVLIVFLDYYWKEIYNVQGNRDRDEIYSNIGWLPGYLEYTSCDVGSSVNFNEELFKKINTSFVDSGDVIEYGFIFEEVDKENTLITNRYGESISFIEHIDDGNIILMPKFENMYGIISKILKNFLPEIKNELFPDFVQNSWLNQDEYIFNTVKQLMNEKDDVLNKLEKEKRRLDELIDEERKKTEFLTDILISQGTGEFLSSRVVEVLRFIGYTNVIDMDEVNIGKPPQEDLRIESENRFTIVEVKGQSGNPNEDNCQALNKYLNRNRRNENRSDIHGILIINHQRMISPCNRSDPAYTLAQIDDALLGGYTLVTTKRLFKAVRLLIDGILRFEDIDEMLHTPGLFNYTPKSWENIGELVKVIRDDNKIKNIACFRLGIESLRVGDTLVVDSNGLFFKQKLNSMHVDGEECEIAYYGDKISIKLSNPVYKNDAIYVIK